jgi:hypothetical protein
MMSFRDEKAAERGLELLAQTNHQGIVDGVSPFSIGLLNKRESLKRYPSVKGWTRTVSMLQLPVLQLHYLPLLWLPCPCRLALELLQPVLLFLSWVAKNRVFKNLPQYQETELRMKFRIYFSNL